MAFGSARYNWVQLAGEWKFSSDNLKEVIIIIANEHEMCAVGHISLCIYYPINNCFMVTLHIPKKCLYLATKICILHVYSHATSSLAWGQEFNIKITECHNQLSRSQQTEFSGLPEVQRATTD